LVRLADYLCDPKDSAGSRILWLVVFQAARRALFSVPQKWKCASRICVNDVKHPDYLPRLVRPRSSPRMFLSAVGFQALGLGRTQLTPAQLLFLIVSLSLSSFSLSLSLSLLTYASLGFIIERNKIKRQLLLYRKISRTHSLSFDYPY